MACTPNGLVVAPASSVNRRPAVEYIRDVYAELVEMGEGARRPGDRSDISSDEEDEMEVCQTNHRTRFPPLKI